MKKKILNIFYILFCATILVLAVRGVYGNPTKETINQLSWTELGPFELSPERGRFALTFSFVEENSLSFSLPIAKFTLPDLGYINGKYVSLFAPGLSFITIPGYLVGRYFGVSQVGTYLIIAVFALINTLLIRSISQQLGAKNLAATIGSLIFLFATPAFTYAVSLFQHHISTFLILSGVYFTLTDKSWKYLIFTFFLFGIAICVDYPNAFLMAPIIIYTIGNLVSQRLEGTSLKVSLHFGRLIALAGLIPPILFFLWFNKASYGSPFQLSGTVRTVTKIDEKGMPVDISDPKDEDIQRRQETKEQAALAYFETRNLINGLSTHTISPDRGILYYAPIVIFGVLGFSELRKKRNREFSLLLSIVGVNLILYSMWGDPWGGWAFGSRYLVPSYAIMSIFIAVGLDKIRRNSSLALFFMIVSVYSIGVNTLGAVTSSANPPKIQVENLQLQSGRVEKYTFERNWDFLLSHGSKSFVYNQFAAKNMTALKYYLLISGAIISVSLLAMFKLFLSREPE